MKKSRFVTRIFCLLLCLGMLLTLCGCGDTKQTKSQIISMNTSVNFVAYGKNAEAGIQAASSVFKSLDAALDPELSTSTVYAINHADGKSTVVSGQIADMITKAQTVYKQSGGALDLTIYPFVELWGFIDNKYYVPTGEQILNTLSLLCFDKVVLDSFPVSGTYTLTMPSYGKLTLASVGRGGASDYAIKAMANAGVTSGIISMNGNVQTLGVQPNGKLWEVAIQDPNHPSDYLGTIQVGQTALSTTGAYQCEFTDITTGNVYNHMIRPNSGYTVSGSLKSATVICADGTYADAIATAAYVMGQSSALSYWRSYGSKEGQEFEMILVNENDQVICTSGLIEQFTLTNTEYELKYTE